MQWNGGWGHDVTTKSKAFDFSYCQGEHKPKKSLISSIFDQDSIFSEVGRFVKSHPTSETPRRFWFKTCRGRKRSLPGFDPYGVLFQLKSGCGTCGPAELRFWATLLLQDLWNSNPFKKTPFRCEQRFTNMTTFLRLG